MALILKTKVSEGGIIPLDSGEMWQWSRNKESETIFVTLNTAEEYAKIRKDRETKKRMDVFKGVVRDLLKIYQNGGYDVTFGQIEQRLKECTGLAEWVGFPKKGGSIEMGWEYQSSKMSVKKYKEWLKDVEHWWFEKFKDLPPTIVKMKGFKE